MEATLPEHREALRRRATAARAKAKTAPEGSIAQHYLIRAGAWYDEAAALSIRAEKLAADAERSLKNPGGEEDADPA
jgi:hypothetical protein